MSRIKTSHRALTLASAVLFIAAPVSLAQRRLPIGGSTVPTDGSTPSLPSASESGNGGDRNGLPTPDDNSNPVVSRNIEALRSNIANAERQRQLTREANQLLQLAAELQLKLSRNKPEVSHEEAMRQIDAIEKLARNVKDRMKGGR